MAVLDVRCWVSIDCLSMMMMVAAVTCQVISLLQSGLLLATGLLSASCVSSYVISRDIPRRKSDLSNMMEARCLQKLCLFLLSVNISGSHVPVLMDSWQNRALVKLTNKDLSVRIQLVSHFGVTPEIISYSS